MDALLRGNHPMEQPKQVEAARPTLEDEFELAALKRLGIVVKPFFATV